MCEALVKPSADRPVCLLTADEAMDGGDTAIDPQTKVQTNDEDDEMDLDEDFDEAAIDINEEGELNRLVEAMHW